MSLPMEIKVHCSQCGAPLSATAFQSVNTGYADNIPMQIISSELFDVECPHCKGVSHLEYDVLYNDMEHDAMVWVIHKKGRTPEEYAAKVEEICATTLPSYKTLRIVEDMNALKEKVSCLEQGRNDRVIELYKASSVANLYSQRPDFDLEAVFYSIASGQELFYFYDTSGKSLYHELTDETYDFLEKLYHKSSAETNLGCGFEIVDFDWAEETLLQLLKTKRDV